MSTRYTPVEWTEGSCGDLDLVYRDGNDALEDITDDVFTIGKASPAEAFVGAVLTKQLVHDEVSQTDVLGVHLHITKEKAALLGMGNVNWFRVVRTFLDGCTDISEPIWINIT